MEVTTCNDLDSLTRRARQLVFDVRTIRAERLSLEYPEGNALREAKVPWWARKHLTLCTPERCVCTGGEAGLPCSE